MTLALIVALVLGLTDLQSNHKLVPEVISKDDSSEIANLLGQLAPKINGPPGRDRIERVRARLVQIAKQSPEARKRVIDGLVPVLNAPKGEFDFQEVDRWRTAVALLGELNAIEAIDDLVRNINWTSYSGLPHPTPPVRAALVRIGEPAVPRLLSALSDVNELTRREASEALGEIGERSFDGLFNVLASSAPIARAGAADSLARIGGVKAREAIEIALRLETDEGAKKRLEYAVEYMDHVECMKDSSKCK